MNAKTTISLTISGPLLPQFLRAAFTLPLLESALLTSSYWFKPGPPMLSLTPKYHFLNADPPCLAVEIEGETGLFAIRLDQYAMLDGLPDVADLPFSAAPYVGIPSTDGYTIDRHLRFYSKLGTPR